MRWALNVKYKEIEKLRNQLGIVTGVVEKLVNKKKSTETSEKNSVEVSEKKIEKPVEPVEPEEKIGKNEIKIFDASMNSRRRYNNLKGF